MLVCSSAYASVTISSSTFPDSVFRECVSSSFDINSDGVLSDTEISAVTAININSKGISRLNGIEYFTALEDLRFSINNVANIDLSKNTALVSLDCRNTYLTRLDVSNSPSLRRLYINDQNDTLQLLNISNTALTKLHTEGCDLYQLQTLIARNCTKLERITNYDDDFRSLNTIDLTGCTSLTQLFVSNTNLTSLDLSNCTALRYLDCYNNSLTYLDLSNNSALEDVNFAVQKTSAQLASSGSPSIFGFTSIIPSEHLASVISDSVHGYSSSGSIIDTTYDPSTGIATFASTPSEIDYDYSTGWGDTILHVTITVTDSGTSSSSTTWPEISTSSLNDAVAGLNYSAAIYATGSRPITYTLTSGSLPEGFILSSAGLISGITSQTGTYTFTVQAANSAGSVSLPLALNVTASETITAPLITTSSLTEGTVSADYGFTFRAAGTRPISWAIVSGDIPGLEVSSEGQLTGIPTQEGTFTFTVQAQNFTGAASKDLTITINPAPINMKPTITTMELALGTADTEYNYQLTASGTPPIKWEIIKGKLPKNLQLSSSGMITGLLKNTGKKKFTVKASNSYGSDSRIITLYSYKYPEITTTALKEAIAGKSYRVTIGKKGTKPFTWTLEGGLPSGLTFDNDKCKISGKADETGTYILRFMLSNPVGDVVREFTLNVRAELPKLSPAKLKDGKIGKEYSLQLKAKGTTPITFTIDGTLPAGLTFNTNTGLLSGTPTEECSNNKITVTASNIGGDTQKIYYLTVKGIAPKITTKKLPDATTGSAYSAVIEATGSSPLTWSASGLPSGLSFSNGSISGTPSEAGKFKVKITLSNNTKAVKKSYSLKVAAGENSASTLNSANINTHSEIPADYVLYNRAHAVNDYVIVAGLGTVSVDENGMHDFTVALSDDVPASAKLLWLANSSEPSDDDNIAEFYDEAGEEIVHVPDDRIITVSAWLNVGTIYKPAIAVRR